MALFRKKNTISADTMVSQYLSDMYDGGTATAELVGGMSKNKYIFQSTIPPQPTFGDAELSSLDFDFYVDSITIGENTTKYPTVASYLIKEGVSITEGYQSHLTSDILCFSSVMDGYTSSSDIMDGSGTSGGDGVLYENIARTIFRSEVNFAYVVDLKKHGQKGYKWHHTKDNHSTAEIRRDFGRPASDFGQVDTQGGLNNYVQVSDKTEYPWFGTDHKKGWKKCIPNDAHAGIGYEIWIPVNDCQMNVNADMSTTEGYGNEATPSNTIFEMVRGSAEFSDYDTDANSQLLLGVGMPRFNTENFKTGAQSLELFTFWTGEGTNKTKVTYEGITGGPDNRQECLLVKKNIPYPNKKPALPSKTRDGITRMVTADISLNTFIDEGHGLALDTVVFFDDITFNPGRGDVWAGSFVGTSGTDATDMQTRNATHGHRVRNLNHTAGAFITDTNYTILTVGSTDFTAIGASANTVGVTFKATGAGSGSGTATSLDTFQLSKHKDTSAPSGDGDDYIYALTSSGSSDKHVAIRIADENNEVYGTNHSQREAAAFDDYDYSEHASVIEMDINIKKLAKAYAYTMDDGEVYNGASTPADAGVPSGKMLTLRRGFHVVFGTTPPETNETLYDYIGRMSGLRDASGQADAPWRITGPGFADMTGTDDTDTLFAIRGSANHDKSTSQNPCFGGFSILNTEHGLQVIPFNGVNGVSGTNAFRPSCGLYIADHDLKADDDTASEAKGDLFLRQQSNTAATNIGATGQNIQVPIEDQWVKFTMAFDPATSIMSDGGSEGVGFNPSDDAASLRSEFSLGRLFLSDTSGEIIPVGTGAAGSTGRNFLDLALFGDGETFFSYNENAGKVSGGSFVVGEKYKITDVATSDWTGWGGDSSAAVGEIFIATGDGAGNTGNKATSLTQDPSNWPKHMSIWLTNYKSDRTDGDIQSDKLLVSGTDAESKVLLDAIRFKDFNYEITNSSQLDGQAISNPIKIESGRSFGAPYGLFPSFSSLETRFGSNKSTIDAYYTRTPSILTIGVKNRNYLSYLSTSAVEEYMPWTEFPYGWWLNDFSASNLSGLGTIPDDHIKGTISMAHYNDIGSNPENSIPLGKQFSQLGIDHTEQGESYNAGTIIPHNGYLAYDDDPYTGSAAFSTSFLNTGLKITSNDVSAKQFVCATVAQFNTQGVSIRVGDKVRLNENTIYRGGNPASSYEYTVATVTGAMDSGLTFTVTETPTSSGDGGETDLDNWAANYIVLIQTPGLCRNFSQKGGFQIYNNSFDEHTAVKRENIAASARIMEISESTSGGSTITVDTMAPFDNELDEEYVVYIYGAEATFSDHVVGEPDIIAADSANVKTGLTIVGKDAETNSITLDWDGKDNAGTAILNYDNIHQLYISPWRYWALIMINLADADGKELSSRQYGNIQLLNNDWTDKNSVKRSWLGEALHNDSTNDYVDTAYSNRTGLGTTFNEFLFNDTSTGGVNGAYLNSWNLDRMADHSQIECDTDFGFGSYDSSENNGGYTGKTVVVDSQYNRIEMPGVIEGARLKPNDSVGFLVDYQDVGLTHRTTFRASGSTTYAPYLFAVFEDEKPQNPTITIKPNEEDPFLPEIEWKAADSDLWYGILHIDDKSIDSQYHNAIFHMPMNEDGVHGSTVSQAGNDLFENDTTHGSTSKTALFTYSQATVDAEGLAGNCIRFDGSNDVITYTPDTSSSEDRAFPELSTAVASGGTGQASIVVHITPDKDISGTTNEIFKGMPFHIKYDATNGKIIANVYTAASNYVELTSPDIIKDGQTPTCVIVTIDNSLKTSNCKLFINGALVDQSGKISSSAPGAGGNNWQNSSGTPVVPYTHTDAVTIGNATNSFDGRIEELVLYKSCIYPIVPTNGKFVLDKSLQEIKNQSPITYNARLFVKDYHNIRGSTTDEVAASSPVSYRKAAFRLKD